MSRPKAIVVGSGAGGCMAAKELAARYEVTLLEEGGDFARFAMPLQALEPVRRAGLMLDERMISVLFPEMRVIKANEGLVHVQGRCVGGTTTLATGNCVRCDGSLKRIGVNLDWEFAELEREVPRSTAHIDGWNETTRRLFGIFEQRGLNPTVMPKFMTGAGRCVACGRCVLGCPTGAKWTADMLLEGVEHVTVVTHAKVERLLAEDGRARGVEVRRGLGVEEMPADLIVLAAGGLGTPAILLRSGIEVERTFFDDPVICLAAVLPGAGMDKQIPMPFASQQDGYILSPYFDLLSFFFNDSWRHPAGDIVSLMVKFADSNDGSYNGKRLSAPYSAHDHEIVERSLTLAMDVLGDLGVRPADTFCGTLNAGHPGGMLPLTPAEASTLHSARLPENVYVADSTLFPESMGNPPMLTIMALAKKVARLCLA